MKVRLLADSRAIVALHDDYILPSFCKKNS